MTKRALFICVENANRSQMAQAFATMLGGDEIVAYSGGSKPSGVVNTRAIQAMAELGYDLSAHESTSVDALPEVEFDFAATMGCGDSCALIKARKTENWDIPDPKHMPSEQFRQVRDLIKAKVEAVLENLD